MGDVFPPLDSGMAPGVSPGVAAADNVGSIEQVVREIVARISRDPAFLAVIGPDMAANSAAAEALRGVVAQHGRRVLFVRGSASAGLHLTSIAAQLLGKPDAAFDRNDIERLFDVLTDPAEIGRPAVLIIDGAEALQQDAVNYLRLLSTLASGAAPQIVFVGRPGFWQAAAELKDLIAAHWALRLAAATQPSAEAQVAVLPGRGAPPAPPLRQTAPEPAAAVGGEGAASAPPATPSDPSNDRAATRPLRTRSLPAHEDAATATVSMDRLRITADMLVTGMANPTAARWRRRLRYGVLTATAAVIVYGGAEAAKRFALPERIASLLAPGPAKPEPAPLRGGPVTKAPGAQEDLLQASPAHAHAMPARPIPTAPTLAASAPPTSHTSAAQPVLVQPSLPTQPAPALSLTETPRPQVPAPQSPLGQESPSQAASSQVPPARAQHIQPGTTAGDTPRAAASTAKSDGTKTGVAGRSDAPAPRQETASAKTDTAAAGPDAATARPEPLDVKSLLARGDKLLAQGDVAGARLLFERAASQGSGRAATLVGRTYDPAFLASIKAGGTPPDPSLAAAWYRSGETMGDGNAALLRKRLRSNDAGD